MFHMGWFLGTGFGVYGWNQQWSGNAGKDVAKPGSIHRRGHLARAGRLRLHDARGLLGHPRRVPGLDGASAQGRRHPPGPDGAGADSRRGDHEDRDRRDRVDLVLPAVPRGAADGHARPPHGRPGRGQSGDLEPATPRPRTTATRSTSSTTCATRWPTSGCRCVKALWDTWEPGALVLDEERGIFADHTKVHPANFEGKFFRSRGPLEHDARPAGPPGDLPGRRLAAPARTSAAKHADTIIAVARRGSRRGQHEGVPRRHLGADDRATAASRPT